MSENRTMVSATERANVVKAVLSWLNTYPDLPVKRVEYEYLSANGMALSVSRQQYRTKECVDGSYEAELLFNIVYRDRPTSMDSRYAMDTILEKMAEWCENTEPLFEEPVQFRYTLISDNVSMTARYEDGTEDHQISLRLTYYVGNEDF